MDGSMTLLFRLSKKRINQQIRRIIQILSKYHLITKKNIIIIISADQYKIEVAART
jgi:hypothetical protein